MRGTEAELSEGKPRNESDREMGKVFATQEKKSSRLQTLISGGVEAKLCLFLLGGAALSNFFVLFTKKKKRLFSL